MQLGLKMNVCEKSELIFSHGPERFGAVLFLQSSQPVLHLMHQYGAGVTAAGF